MGMVLCLVILTDLQTRRAGLSALAELLVVYVIVAWSWKPSILYRSLKLSLTRS